MAAIKNLKKDSHLTKKSALHQKRGISWEPLKTINKKELIPLTIARSYR